MARTVSLTRTYSIKVQMGHFEGCDCTVSETVELEPGDDRTEVLQALRARLQAELQHDETRLRSLSLYDKKTGRNIFVRPDDESDNEQARRLLPRSHERVQAERERMFLKNAAAAQPAARGRRRS